MTEDLVSTGVAAKRLGIARGTLARWWQQGKVMPAYVTIGGQARWDVPDLRRQIMEWRQPED